VESQHHLAPVGRKRHRQDDALCESSLFQAFAQQIEIVWQAPVDERREHDPLNRD
jgi:hypothetical protein